MTSIIDPYLHSNGFAMFFFCRITIDKSPAIPLDWIGTMQKLPLRRRQTCRPTEVERLNFKHRKARLRQYDWGKSSWYLVTYDIWGINLYRCYLIFSSQRSRYPTSWAVAELSFYSDRSPVVSGTGRRTWNAKAAAGEAGKVGPNKPDFFNVVIPGVIKLPICGGSNNADVW